VDVGRNRRILLIDETVDAATLFGNACVDTGRAGAAVARPMALIGP